MISTTSTASTPICRPQLPPEIVMNAGALQPLAVRQVATPLPPLAPKIKPPLTMCGITATHFACSNTSSGIPLSGIPIISCNTLVALSSRSEASSRADPAQHSVPRLNIASTNITFFMHNLLIFASAPHLRLRAAYTVKHNLDSKCRPASSILTLANWGSKGLSNRSEEHTSELQSPCNL